MQRVCQVSATRIVPSTPQRQRKKAVQGLLREVPARESCGQAPSSAQRKNSVRVRQRDHEHEPQGASIGRFPPELCRGLGSPYNPCLDASRLATELGMTPCIKDWLNVNSLRRSVRHRSLAQGEASWRLGQYIRRGILGKSRLCHGVSHILVHV